MTTPFISGLQSLASRFCRLDFADDLSAASLAGRESGFAADAVDVTREDLNFADNFLTTIHFSWRRPRRLRVSDLRAALGEYDVTRHGLTHQKSYVFELARQPLQGFVHIRGESDDRDSRIDVREVSLRRIAPAPYRVEQGRAFRLIVLGDFCASEYPFREGLAIGIGEGADVNEALARLVPTVHGDVVNHVDPSEETLHFYYSPGTLAEFEIDRLVWAIPQLGALVELRRSLVSLQVGTSSSVALTEKLITDDLPSHWQTRARAAAASPRHVAPLIAEIDRALGNQCEAILSHHRFKALQSAWYGLDYLARQIDFSTGSQIDVFSCSREDLVSTFRHGVVEPETHHRDGLPPALVVLDGSFAAADAGLLQELAELSAAAEIPLVFGGVADEGVPSLSGAGASVASAYIAEVPTRILLGEPLSHRPPRCFEYLPGRMAPDTAVWGSGIWAFAAAAAQSIGHVDIGGVGLAPPVPLTGSLRAADVCRGRRHAVPMLPVSAAKFYVEFVEADQLLSVRSQADQPTNQFRTQLALGPLRQTIYRLRHQHAHRTDREAVTRQITDALNARIPGAAVRVAFRGAFQLTHLVVEVTPRFPIAGKHRGHTLEIPWQVSSP